ncbi:MAG: DinB family protein [Spirochaetia bacterium]|nr:DinB family protein [Spirochaetia bacterium]
MNSINSFLFPYFMKVEVFNEGDLMKLNSCNALCSLLDELKGILSGLEDEDYSEVHSEVFQSSIGTHIRHILDHIKIFIESVASCTDINYDQRERGGAIENFREDAIEEIENFILRLNLLSFQESDRVNIKSMLLPGHSVSFVSSAGRELLFLISHIIHHNAVIAAILKEKNLAVPKYFGYAPSTIEYMERI